MLPRNSYLFLFIAVRFLAKTRFVHGMAVPKRLSENVAGPVFVNEKHYVYHQPETDDEIDKARAALIACPVASIRVDPKAETSTKHDDNDKELLDHSLAREMALSPKLNGRPLPFPRPIFPGVDDVYYIGHHSEHSFGAVPYLVRGRSSTASSSTSPVWVMVDTPKFGASAKKAITALTGPDGPQYLLMTHVDDTAHHGEWAKEFPNMKQIFHAGDLGRHNWIGDKTLEQVDILLRETSTNQQLTAFTIDGTPIPLQQAIDDDKEDLIILHTPGHSPGSITLWKKPSRHGTTSDDHDSPGILLTGDTYGYSSSRGAMSGFPRYGNNLSQQAETLQLLLSPTTALDWQIIAPGHGHSRDYRQEDDQVVVKKEEMEEALEQFQAHRRRW